MEYKGNLYGKVGKGYFKLQKNTDDIDTLIGQNKKHKELISELKQDIETHLKLTKNSKIFYAMVDENGVYAIDKFLMNILKKLK
jgi:uncharacterized protein YeeX (DUF496 family)